jgi:hypothetical protein
MGPGQHPLKGCAGDNERFADLKLRNHLVKRSQSISYSGVNVHFQNTLAKKHIRELQDSAGTMLVDPKHSWPKVINSHLWPNSVAVAGRASIVSRH